MERNLPQYRLLQLGAPDRNDGKWMAWEYAQRSSRQITIS